ncbi:MAG: helix-turn-helix transcriptional regulator [Solirubrobacterales bacterium]|nr:helix-turn-helix transcriptional regulator [Solirubrobacterales bacterium]
MASATRTYGQMCPVARSLDVLGERWTLLIVRELLLGPKRFKDLLAELPAMGTNRLSDRLKSLEADGVIAKMTLPPPGEARVYVLTDLGEQLRAPVVCLAQWGAGLPLDERLDPSTARGVLLALVRCATAPPELLRGVRETYDFMVGTERFHIIVDHDRAIPRSGPSPVSADVTIECDIQTLLMLDAGALTPAGARCERNARIDGRAAAIRRAFAIMRRRT